MSQEAQDMIDTRALEKATEASQKATDAIDAFNNFMRKFDEHERHDETRFTAVKDEMKLGFKEVALEFKASREAVSSGFNGLYNRLWAGVGLIVVALIGALAWALDNLWVLRSVGNG